MVNYVAQFAAICGLVLMFSAIVALAAGGLIQMFREDRDFQNKVKKQREDYQNGKLDNW